MPLVSTAEVFARATSSGAGVAAFNVVTLEGAQALVRAAETAQRPLILQLSQNAIAYHGAIEPISAAIFALAQGSDAQLAVHLDHAEDADLARRAIDLGFGSVMYDGAVLPFDQNVQTTRDVVAYAHAAGAIVEAELGEIGGKDGAHAPGVRTDPGEAAEFVAATGVDALAVAVGSSHAMTERSSRLDFDLISQLRDAVDVPLVLHGSSGVADADIVTAIRSGIRKVNVSTHLNAVFTAPVREILGANPGLVDPRKYLTPAREAMATESARLLRLISDARLEETPR